MKHMTSHASAINGVQRVHVPDSKISWSVEWRDYKPPDYTSPHIHNQPWADPDIDNVNFEPCWNAIDGQVDRKSFVTNYQIWNKRPLNPVGRTGLQGRGILGRWGPNKAADPIVTRWKMAISGEKVADTVTNRCILQFVAIERRDTGDWAIPGGMVDPGEHVSTTLKREFMEETLNILGSGCSEEVEARVDLFFQNGKVVHRGYVADRRNTDNAWIETTVAHYHDEDNKSVGCLPFSAGDDARNVQWLDIWRGLKLYANHLEFIENVAKNLHAHW